LHGALFTPKARWGLASLNQAFANSLAISVMYIFNFRHVFRFS